MFIKDWANVENKFLSLLTASFHPKSMIIFVRKVIGILVLESGLESVYLFE